MRQSAAAQAKANRDLEVARDQQKALKDAVAQTRAELRQQREALQSGGDGGAVYAERIKDSASQLKVLVDEQRSAEQVKALESANKAAAAESRAAAQAEKALADEYARSVQSAGQLSGVLGDQNRSLTQARQALDAAGISTQGLSDEQAELVAAQAGWSGKPRNTWRSCATCTPRPTAWGPPWKRRSSS